MFQTHNPKIADAVEASGEVFEFTPAPQRAAQPVERKLLIPIAGRVTERAPLVRETQL